MPPAFKNPLRSLISAVLPMSVLSALGSEAGSKAVPVGDAAMAIIVWMQLIMALLRPWSGDSRAVWAELMGYRINKAYLCKNSSSNEHEYIVVDMSRPENKDHLYLRIERTAGDRKDTPTSSPSSSSIGSYTTDSDKSPSPSPSPDFYEQSSSGSSISIASMKESITKVSGSLQRAARRLSDSSLSRPSGISSSRYSAADTVKKLDSLPSMAKVVRTVEFKSSDRSNRPCLWDLMILAYVIHEDSLTYELLDRQCFWFADTISAILEKWSETCTDVAIIDGKPRSRFLKRNKSSGSVGILVVHRRKADIIEKLWAKFQKRREELNAERQEFENTRREELRQAEELARQLAEVKRQQKEKDWQLNQQIVQLAEVKRRQEQQLAEVKRQQEEKDRQLAEVKKQQEKDRQERERERQEQEREREEMQRQFQRQLQQQLQENNREWETRLQQQQQQTNRDMDRRFDEIQELLKLYNSRKPYIPAPIPPPDPS